MNLTVNGESRTFDDEKSVDQLLISLNLQEKRVVVELNGGIIERSAYADTCLADGDSLEIIQFVPGG
jgi:sulfur carrier protein